MTLTPQENEAMLVKKALECEYPCGSILKAEVRRLLEREKVLEEVIKTRDHYEKELANAKAKRDKRVYELTEVAYLASLRPHLAAISALNPGTKEPKP